MIAYLDAWVHRHPFVAILLTAVVVTPLATILVNRVGLLLRRRSDRFARRTQAAIDREYVSITTSAHGILLAEIRLGRYLLAVVFLLAIVLLLLLVIDQVLDLFSLTGARWLRVVGLGIAAIGMLVAFLLSSLIGSAIDIYSAIRRWREAGDDWPTRGPGTLP